MVIRYDTKLIKSGNVIEVYHYEHERFRGYSRQASSGGGDSPIHIDYETGEIIDKRLESRKRSNIRARNHLRRLILSNFDRNSKFLTLTFRENVSDLTEANECFKAFVRNVNIQLKKRNKGKFEYVAVVEYQKRGAIHYHMICNLPYIRVEILRDCWKRAVKEREGNIDIKVIKHVDNVGAYVVKYMTKAGADTRLINKKLYQTSRGLKKPTELVGQEAQRYIESLQLKDKKIAYRTEYQDAHTLGT
ncbi:Rep protein, partial [Priestia megaterium]|uniref:rolling circle replication-associated protein n=1 Tax=Priestia megaterium TaxID=1404 RepID=UPI002E1AA140|nr:Rep protein [Priestia megaterium]